MAVFITFEGGEGAGKSTQAALLLDRLRREKRRAIHCEEPGTTLLGTMLRQWLRNRDRSLALIPKENEQLALLEGPIKDHLLPDILLNRAAPRAELLAFVIARAQLVDEVIIPSLKRGLIVVCDRYADSTLAYQGYGRGLDLKLVKMANDIATQGVRPDLTVLLDLAVEEGFARKAGRGQDRFERERADFHRRVRQGYLKLAAEEPDRWLVIDASQSKRAIADIIWQRVSALLGDGQE